MLEFVEKYINPFTDYAHLTPEQVCLYEYSLKYYRDLKNSLDTAREEGTIEGIEKVALNALKMGKPVNGIEELTGLTKEQIEKLDKKER
jgi:predicted transposase/invertase (TIGR01784 family)